MKRYGPAPWIHQVAAAVENAVTLGVAQLSGTQVATNETPLAEGGAYRFQARSREEILASLDQAAADGATLPEASEETLADPAAKIEEAPKIVAPKEWLL